MWLLLAQGLVCVLPSWPFSKATYQTICILTAVCVTQGALFGNESQVSRQISHVILICYTGLASCSVLRMFFSAILSLVSIECLQKLWTEILRLIVSVVFVRHLMGSFGKMLSLSYWGKNVASAKSATGCIMENSFAS